MHLATINALLNTMAAVLLVLGRVAVKQGDVPRHRKLMLSALGVSALFLVLYLANRYIQGELTVYPATGLLKAVYLAILIPHSILAAVILPFILAAVYYALKGRTATHVRIVRWVWPLWLYVSVTGVVIYLMLYVFPPGG